MRLRCLELATEAFKLGHYRDADPEDEICAIAKRFERHISGERVSFADLLTDLMEE